MKITKSQLQKVIKEELAAEINEAQELPANVERLLRMVMDDAGDDKVAAKLAELNASLSLNLKVLLAASILAEFGIPHEEVALKTALTKGMQAAKTAPANAPAPYAAGSKARDGGIPSSQRNPLDDFTGVERRA